MTDREDYLSVTTLTRYLKRKFDADPYLGRVYLTGEISNFRPRPNAHQYFSLKDDHAKINAIMFKSAFAKVKFQPEEGMKVLVTGRISLYEPSGSYQIYVERMEPDGVGALYQAYEQLKRKLASEGLFERRQRPLVKYPKRIAVITSPSGAVIRDIITTTRRRYPIAQLVLFPALVQGDAAADDIVQRIQQVNELGTFDTLIIGRGGGSIEDLWPFNEERVARAIAASEIPVISSVGHETDTTIADLVADVRAATPTAAAELATPVLSETLLAISQLQGRLFQAMTSQIQLDRQRLEQVRQSYVFTQPQRLYEGYTQRVAQLTDQLINDQRQLLNAKQQQVATVRARLSAHLLTARVKNGRQQADALNHELLSVSVNMIRTKKTQLHALINQLDLLSPLKIMTRGYSYVTVEGQVVKTVDQLSEKQAVTLHLADGQAAATINSVDKEKD
ncbi:MAG: exodeoxyribonuclease VII large subunit [Furfurilactobacillus sp.]|jgi:exodeoxyribonuclease VII large subunit|uniref:Exodeoxyribonuclease 7 large subunit n=1 Tax=Furfurilactobacillus milii TaxID=2888272 RepID=A0ABT6D8B2_9LACO|nr:MULTISPECIES: exodeoxyribonuclease VII large subunit [Furfurilactobacillus]QLE66670.1 Exodeoxyribonuclease VII large subunit [Furfurilactobacillus rossiae]MCF6160556.1 exodeoxyribonuclease VII large subunit [Furfurilactobacillus milii]MCF6162788.1 exodeoxyribonuclease VII large subunit [Furfurilactobacillus milii]MCF6419851.1 exodeoxyribonuclease VII large subunit [Furfurilactobacillus milii]MCH4010625.1 exodeoxyribonuclease VII large subunit [Furfurilactobacillus sp.]